MAEPQRIDPDQRAPCSQSGCFNWIAQFGVDARLRGQTVGDCRMVLTKDFGNDKDGYTQEAIIKVRISDHSNVNRGVHFGDSDINIAPDDGYNKYEQ